MTHADGHGQMLVVEANRVAQAARSVAVFGAPGKREADRPLLAIAFSSCHESSAYEFSVLGHLGKHDRRVAAFVHHCPRSRFTGIVAAWRPAAGRGVLHPPGAILLLGVGLVSNPHRME